MSLLPRNPFVEIENFRRQMSGAFNNLTGYYAGKNAFPRINIYQTENEVILKADIGDIPKENIDVSVEDNRVLIRGKTDRSSEFKGKNIYRSERYYGSFVRTVRLPSAVAADKARIENKDGVLSITVPKKVPVTVKQNS